MTRLPPMIRLGGVPCAWCGQRAVVLVLDPAGPRTKHLAEPRIPDCPTDPRRPR